MINVFGNFVYTLRGGDASENGQLAGEELLQPPTLFGIAEATQSAEISFSGLAPSSEGIIEIYLNDRLEDEIDLSSESFEVRIDIKRGINTIKARYLNGNTKSPFTEEQIINYITEKPKLEVNSPSDNQTFTKADKNIYVTGLTDPENDVTINSFRAIVDSDGSFRYLLQLNDGDNQIIVEALNPAGISTQTSLKVIYQPE